MLNIFIVCLSFIKPPHLPILKPIINNQLINTNYQINMNPISKNNFFIKNNFKYISQLDTNYLAMCNENNCKILFKKKYIDNIKINILILFWFILSAKYNIYNKLRLNMLNLPWFHSTISFATGSLLSIFFWKTKIRPYPKLNKKTIITFIPTSFFHAIGHITAVISVAGGAVSFTQIIKASEPVFTCGLNWLILGNVISLPVFLSLLPIVFGVSLASISELSFSWTAFNNAMLSNTACAARNIYSCKTLDNKKTNITPENLLGILSIFSFFIALPLTFVFERNKIPILWASKTISTSTILKTSMETGLYFYLYNEAAMIILNQINPVSHAIINTFKRIFILLACVVFFNTPLTKNGIIGSSIAIIGSYLYSKAKNKSKVICKS